nr:hypothetical protein [Actinoplanes rishiriensis]
MEEAVAQPFRFGFGEITVQGVDLQPADEVGGDRGGNTSTIRVDENALGRQP